MQKPKMVIFDAGRTLLDYTDIDTGRGVSALYPYITENPDDLSADEIDKRTNAIFEVFDWSREMLFEVPETTILKLVYDSLNLKFSISIPEIERIIWNTDAQKMPTKNACEMLRKLKEMGIRMAVISNLDFSGYLLKETLSDLFPENCFEFVIASSDYGIRKPDIHIFQAGIVKSGLRPDEIWYVGDKIPVDIVGSKNAGMIPVLYKSRKNRYQDIPEDLMVIEDLLELIRRIETV